MDSYFLSMDPWHPLFHANDDFMMKKLVWVKLPTLSMDLQTIQSLSVIGNSIGKTLLIDDIFFTSNVKYVVRLLINIDVSLGLHESMYFVMGGKKYSQIIYYQNIPFRCIRCHSYGHMHSDCDKVFLKKFWKKKDILDEYYGRKGKPIYSI